MEAAGDSLVDLCKSDFSSFPKDTGQIILSFAISMIISKFDCFIDQVTVIEEPILTIPYILRWSFDKGVRGDGGTGGQNPTIGTVTKRDTLGLALIFHSIRLQLTWQGWSVLQNW